MNLDRRQILKGMGIGITASLFGFPAAAADTERVFIHPNDGLIGETLSVVETIGGTVLFEYENFPFVAAEIPAGSRDELLSDSHIAFIEDDEEAGIPSGWTPSIPALLAPDDGTDCSTHPDQRPSWGWERIGAGASEEDGSGVNIGILDTGIETNHCSLEVSGGRNFTDSLASNDYEDRHGHGTHVAGVAGALDNDVGVVGVAPSANLYAVKVLDDNGSGRYSSVVAGIDWCMSNDIEIISMSLGGESESSTVDQAIEEAHSAGHLLLCAAGNNGNNGDGSCDEETMTYPARHDDVIAVSAMDEDDSLASYSSVGPSIDLMAPGTNIDSTYVNNEYARASGTSVACPFVTGVAALVWQRDGEDGPGANEAVRAVLEETAETVLASCEEGEGLVNAAFTVSSGKEPRDNDNEAEKDDTDDEDKMAPGTPSEGEGGNDVKDEEEGEETDSDGDSEPPMFERLLRLFIQSIRDLRAIFR